jgi:plastocyanin
MTTSTGFPRHLPSVGRRQVIGAAAALAIAPAAFVASGAASRRGDATPDASPEATPGGTPEALITLEAYEFGFEPAELTVAVGDTLTLFSTGQFPHDFTIEGHEDLAVDFPEDGSEVTWEVPADLPPGEYVFYCSVGNHRAQGMEGVITVEAAEASGDAAAGDDVQTVEAFEFGFEPAELTVAPGDTIDLFSTGDFPHDFVIEGFEDLAVVFPQDGSTATFEVPADMPAGEYVFYCSVGNHRAQGMEGTLTVE